MYIPRLSFLLILLPLLALAQDEDGSATTPRQTGSGSGTGSQTGTGSGTTAAPRPTVITSVITSTSVEVYITTNGNGIERTFTTTHTSLRTTTFTGQPSETGGVTPSRNTTTSQRPLTTANPNVDGGGTGPDGPPLPGGQNGVYGPDDDYIAGAMALKKGGFVAALVGVGAGAALLL